MGIKFNPLGSLVSVAYEIGSAYLSSRDRTAKIAEDFFKSPRQTTIKKIAQCLWVPTVVYGSVKLACYIVKACWNRCFPAANSEKHVIACKTKDPHTDKDYDIILPILEHIFSDLTFHDLGICRKVSKTWKQWIDDTPKLFGSQQYIANSLLAVKIGQRWMQIL